LHQILIKEKIITTDLKNKSDNLIRKERSNTMRLVSLDQGQDNKGRNIMIKHTIGINSDNKKLVRLKCKDCQNEPWTLLHYIEKHCKINRKLAKQYAVP